MTGCFVFDASHPCCGSSCSRKETLSRRQDFIFSPPFVFPTSFPAVRNFKRKSCLTLGLCHALGLGFGSVAGDSKRSQSFCQKCGWQVTAKHTCTLWALHEVTRCMVVWCTQNAPRLQQFHVAPAMPELQAHHFGGYSKTLYEKANRSCLIIIYASAVRLHES